LNKKDSSPCVISRHMSLIDHMSHICPIQDSNPCVSASLRSGAGDSFRVTCPLYVICPIYVFFCEPALWGSNEYLLKGLIEGIITGDDSLNQSLE